MLPGWSGTLGQLLPPGAGGRLLRSTAFFDGHGIAHSVTVLAAWLTLGMVLCLAGGLRHRPTATVADTAAQPALDAPLTHAREGGPRGQHRR